EFDKPGLTAFLEQNFESVCHVHGPARGGLFPLSESSQDLGHSGFIHREKGNGRRSSRPMYAVEHSKDSSARHQPFQKRDAYSVRTQTRTIGSEVRSRLPAAARGQVAAGHTPAGVLKIEDQERQAGVTISRAKVFNHKVAVNQAARGGRTILLHLAPARFDRVAMSGERPQKG